MSSVLTPCCNSHWEVPELPLNVLLFAKEIDAVCYVCKKTYQEFEKQKEQSE